MTKYELLEHIASFPLESFNSEADWADERPLYGANGWILTVGHVRAARRLSGVPTAEQK